MSDATERGHSDRVALTGSACIIGSVLRHFDFAYCPFRAVVFHAPPPPFPIGPSSAFCDLVVLRVFRHRGRP